MKATNAYIIVTNSRNEILLTQRNDVPIWVIPGGHVEAKETGKAAAIRELYEETGLKIQVRVLIAEYKNKYKNKCKHLYSGTVTGGKLIKNSEVRNIRWFSLSTLPHPMSLYEHEKISDYKAYKGKTVQKQDIVDINN